MQFDLAYFEVDYAIIDKACITLGARYREALAVADSRCSVARANYRWDAHLARNNCGVTGTPAAIGDDRGCAFHDRLPVWVSDVGYQHVAWAYSVYLFDTI